MTPPGSPPPALSTPTAGVHASFLAGIAEFRAEGRGRPDDDSVLGHQIRAHGDHWHTTDGFAGYLAALLAEARPAAARPEGIVASTDLWWTQGEAFLGRVSIRHSLTDGLRNRGGHIGYDVVPSARRRGHATAMLDAALGMAADLGIPRALLTCSPANIASRRVIERNGGVLGDADHHVLRFWIATAR